VTRWQGAETRHAAGELLMPPVTLNLGNRLEGALASGHPWIYRNHLPASAANLRSGEWVRLEAGRSSAFGLYDAEGAVGVRVFSSSRIPDQGWFEDRVAAALRLRADLVGDDTTALRLLNGENDGLPGLIADRYGRHVILRLYASSTGSLLDSVVRALSRQLGGRAGRGGIPLRGIALRTDAGLESLYGELPPPEVTVEENGLKFLANLYEGQKTGLFLDQRENRATVRRYSRGRRVLNLFSYSGAFSVYALAGGAEHVTSVDIAAPALRDAERNVELNGFPASRHEAVTADVFELAAGFAADGAQFDLVICDPPSLARDKRSVATALRAYTRVNAAALRLVRPGGMFATASCTARVTPDAFHGVLRDAAQQAGVSAQVVNEAGHAADHPVAVAFPEGRYLKFLLARVLGPA
jgi:23S rRNA (cytosine1962-C5)-methyltransferase